MSTRNATLRPKQNGSSHALKRADGKSGTPQAGATAPGDNGAVANGPFEVVFSTNPLAMYIADQETLEFLEVNAAAIRQYGYSRDEFLRMKLTEIRPAADVPNFLNSIRKHGTSPTGVGHLRHHRKNGEGFDVEVTSRAISFAGKDAVLVVTQDISARRTAEQKVAEHAAFSGALTENSPLAIVALDLDRQVQTCNSAFERLFGYSLADIAGRELDDLIARRDDEGE